MENQLLIPKRKGNIVEFPYRFVSKIDCDALVAIPIGSTLVWQMLCCAKKMHFFDFDLLSIPAFPKRLVEGKNTAVSAIDIAVSRHGIKNVLIFQPCDYHHLKKNTIIGKSRDDAYHKACLREADIFLKQRHKELNVINIYVRIIENEAIFSKIHIDGTEDIVFKMKCNINSICDGIIINCMDFRKWRETLSYAWYILGIKNPTILSVAGGARNIIRGSKTLKKALKLANSVYSPRNGNVAIFHHRRCGAYETELTKFHGNLDGELKYQKAELLAAKKIIETEFNLLSSEFFIESDFKNNIEIFPVF